MAPPAAMSAVPRLAALARLNPHDPYERELATVLLLAKMPTMISYIARRAIGLPLLSPHPPRPPCCGYLHSVISPTHRVKSAEQISWVARRSAS